ncbi:hypothetical protein [Streptomyces sp. HF10]|uniref:hypothetical protein n=1 Tax=Streptomyces sp. HF10 TaxID=2692233 RepID=UPI00131688D0|nr:hypothetical protein [Streptomyces sp. HF10]QHC27523.1 hypothetical protein GR129_00245 [Streptomyces sp. HF10]
MARTVPPRTRASAAVVLASACALLSACGPAHPGADAPATSAAQHGAAEHGAAAQGGTGAHGTTGGGTSYVLTAPQTAAGYPQGQPSADLVQRVNSDLQQSAKRLDVSGTPVHAYYDDRADGAWIFYSGVNGSGFDPDRLHDALDQPPAVKEDGAGDRVTTSAADTDPGPHGGRAICDTYMIENTMLATAATTCSWFTPTTAGAVTLVIKGDGTNTKTGFTATDVAPVMRAIRASTEKPRP